MRRITLALALVLGCYLPAFAQVHGGGISGTVKDQQGGVLPGALTTLQGVDAARTFVTDASGVFRFLELAPGPYKLTIALDGFRTLVRDGLIVEVGKNVELPASLTVGIAESVTVTAATPLVDRKATGTTTNITSDELTRIPASRDPFALMRSVPGVLVDRVNIGGNETGQQSNFTMKGTRPQDAVWTLDGIVVTDMTLAGASPTYFNFDNFQEIQVSTSGQDITQPTGGLGMNFVVKRGTNAFHGGMRGYFGADGLQASNVPGELIALGATDATADHVRQISIRRTDRLEPRVVLWIVFQPGHPPRLPDDTGCGGSHRAEQPQPQVELPGDEERPRQLPVLRRLQDERQQESWHDGHHQQRADGALPSGQRVRQHQAARTLEDRGRSRHQLKQLRLGEVRVLQHWFCSDA